MKPGDPPPAVLVVGYGNPLRGDDAAGPALADWVAAQPWPGILTFTPHQLTPELAEAVSAAQMVIFADANPAAARAELRALQPASESSARDGGHALKPETLLALSQSLFHRCPPAWLVGLPSEAFDHGAALSVAALRGLIEGRALVRDLLVRWGRLPEMPAPDLAKPT